MIHKPGGQMISGDFCERKLIYAGSILPGQDSRHGRNIRLFGATQNSLGQRWETPDE
jgi:hypothetical protein